MFSKTIMYRIWIGLMNCEIFDVVYFLCLFVVEFKHMLSVIGHLFLVMLLVYIYSKVQHRRPQIKEIRVRVKFLVRVYEYMTQLVVSHSFST